MSIYDYTQIPGNNTTVGGNSIAEGAAAGLVNNAIRGLVAEIAEWRDDLGGANTSAGTADAQTLTTDGTIGALANGLMVSFKAGATNTSTTATLNVDSLGAKKMRRLGDTALLAGDITSGNRYLAQYDSAADAAAGGWIILNPSKAPNDGDLAHLAGTETFTGNKTFNGSVIIQDDAAGRLRFNNATWGGRVGRILASDDGNFILRPTSAADTDFADRDLRFRNDTDKWRFQDDLEIGNDLYMTGDTFLSGTNTTPAVSNISNAAVFKSGSRLEISTVDNIALLLNHKDTDVSGSGSTTQFRFNGTAVGAISHDATSTTYGTSSDARLKEGAVPLEGAINARALLGDALASPQRYRRRDGNRGMQDGFIAQDLAQVVPGMVTPGVGEPGDPEFVPWMIDYGKATPYLWAICQAQQKMIEALETRVAALEAAP